MLATFSQPFFLEFIDLLDQLFLKDGDGKILLNIEESIDFRSVGTDPKGVVSSQFQEEAIFYRTWAIFSFPKIFKNRFVSVIMKKGSCYV